MLYCISRYKNKVSIFTTPIVLCVFLIVLSQSSFAQTNTYEAIILKERSEKDRTFHKEQDSPIPKKERRHFKGLVYFPVDSSYRVQARLVKDTSQKVVKMQTSTSRVPSYRIYGEIVFTLKGQKCKLVIYQSLDLLRNPMYKDFLFLPFTDVNTGDTTYGAGRYIDMRISDNEVVTIDFNRAYNPYCAYSDQYSCPVTPTDNQLPIRIDAGEKIYRDH